MRLGAFTRSIARVLIACSDWLVSFIFPYFSDMSYSSASDKQGDSGVVQLKTRLKRCLIANMSFIFEPVFRIRVLKLLLAHVSDSGADYHVTRSTIQQLLSRRNFLCRHLLPTDHLRRCLGSVGFYSVYTSPGLLEGPGKTPTLKGFILKISILIRQGDGALALLNSLQSAADPKDRGEPSGDFKALNLGRKSLGRTKIFVVGPGETADLSSAKSCDEVWLLVTPNFDLAVLENVLSDGIRPWLFLNNVSAGRLLDTKQSDPRTLISSAAGIYASQTWSQSLKSLGVQTISYASTFSEMFLDGSPNLLPRAVGFAIQRNASLYITGVDLYTGRRIYAQDRGENATPQSKQRYHPFFTSASLAGHNPIVNFNFLRWAFKLGHIEGDQNLTKLLSISVADYLSILDESVGRARR